MLAPPELVGPSAVVGRVRDAIARAAAAGRGVLFVAEAGTDVASVARELHALSRPGGPFVAMDCAADGVERLLLGEADPLAPRDLESVSSD